MNDDEIRQMAILCDEIDQFINSKVKDLLEQGDKHVVVNTMINVATNTLSKVMLLVRDDMRQAVMQTAISITYDKIKEGDAMVESIKTILHAQGIGSTCQPIPPLKH